MDKTPSSGGEWFFFFTEGTFALLVSVVVVCMLEEAASCREGTTAVACEAPTFSVASLSRF